MTPSEPAGTTSPCTYDKTGVLHSQGQAEQPGPDVPLQDVDQGLENAEGETETPVKAGIHSVASRQGRSRGSGLFSEAFVAALRSGRSESGGAQSVHL